MRKGLLICGILSMLWYVAINIVVPMHYAGYDSASLTVSELSAIGAPTRTLWVVLCIFYSILFIAFGMGIWFSANENRHLQVVSVVILIDAILGFVLASDAPTRSHCSRGGTLTDTLHLIWAFVHLGLMLLMLGFGAVVFGKSFRAFTGIIVLTFIVFGILTTRESMGIEANLPTPNAGTWERVNIGAYMLWVIIFAIMLMRKAINLLNCSPLVAPY
jgi:hypothetical protein